MKRNEGAARAVPFAEPTSPGQIRSDLSGRSSTTDASISAKSAAASRSTLALLEGLAQPWLDRSIAFIAMVPFLYLTYYRYEHMRLGIPLASFAIGIAITFVTMILRRPPKRVTPNPLYWLLTFVATYWALLTLGVMQSGRPVVASLVSDVVALCSLVVIVWARLSLGRNIGFVPARLLSGRVHVPLQPTAIKESRQALLSPRSANCGRRSCHLLRDRPHTPRETQTPICRGYLSQGHTHLGLISRSLPDGRNKSWKWFYETRPPLFYQNSISRRRGVL